jgi:hypothetical protein
MPARLFKNAQLVGVERFRWLSSRNHLAARAPD